ncbi:hypothetical protein GGR56DRAFT_260703 [Xylariaceae sp. FL0804]|nr:hypothetical protein GGR56DRAFT_260703 [Xylariaceae sp. FL0804]
MVLLLLRHSQWRTQLQLDMHLIIRVEVSQVGLGVTDCLCVRSSLVLVPTRAISVDPGRPLRLRVHRSQNASGKDLGLRSLSRSSSDQNTDSKISQPWREPFSPDLEHNQRLRITRYLPRKKKGRTCVEVANSPMGYSHRSLCPITSITSRQQPAPRSSNQHPCEGDPDTSIPHTLERHIKSTSPSQPSNNNKAQKSPRLECTFKYTKQIYLE